MDHLRQEWRTTTNSELDRGSTARTTFKLLVAVVGELVIEERSWRRSSRHKLSASLVSHNCISSAVQCSVWLDWSRFASHFSDAVLSVENRLDCVSISRRRRNSFVCIVLESNLVYLARWLHIDSSRAVPYNFSRRSSPINVSQHHLEWQTLKAKLVATETFSYLNKEHDQTWRKSDEHSQICCHQISKSKLSLNTSKILRADLSFRQTIVQAMLNYSSFHHVPQAGS